MGVPRNLIFLIFHQKKHPTIRVLWFWIFMINIQYIPIYDIWIWTYEYNFWYSFEGIGFSGIMSLNGHSYIYIHIMSLNGHSFMGFSTKKDVQLLKGEGTIDTTDHAPGGDGQSGCTGDGPISGRDGRAWSSTQLHGLMTHMCVYIYLYIHTNTYTYIRTYVHYTTFTLHYIALHCITLHYTHTRTHVHTYIRTYVQTYMRTYVQTYIHTYIHTYVRTYVHTYIHIYMHTYITYPKQNIGIYITTKLVINYV